MDQDALQRLLANRDFDALYEYVDQEIETCNARWRSIIGSDSLTPEVKLNRLSSLNGEMVGLETLKRDLKKIQNPSPDVSSESEDPSSASED